MAGIVRLTENERKSLLKTYRTGGDARTARRAHILLLVSDGRSYREIQGMLYCGADLIAECVQRFREGRVEAVLERGTRTSPIPAWLLRVAKWLVSSTPRDFGYFRSRWSCETLAEVLFWETGVRKGRETIRRGLRRMEFVWRRPRPIVGPEDPEHAEKLAAIRRLLAELPEDETAVFQDEVDVHLNPKIGSCWMARGLQAEVTTPGNNQKRHLAGSLHWRTGRLLVSAPGTSRNTKLFLTHLDDLRRCLRGYRLIHVICDNAKFHTSRAVRQYLERWGHRIRLHFLPKYAPQTNPIERIWWRMHETLTRNHCCETLDELLTEVYQWFNTQHSFYTSTLTNYAQAA